MIRLVCIAALIASGLLAATFGELSAQARAAREANDIPRAIELYKQALALNKNWQEGWWFFGTLLYDGDQYAAARDAFQHVIQLDAKAAPAWALLGLCEFETAEYTKSLADIERGVSLGAAKESQMEPVLIYHEAMLLTLAGEFDKALQKYGTLVRNGAKSESLLVSIGLTALHARRLPKDITSGERDLLLGAGKTASAVLAGDYSQADAEFRDLLDRYPKAAGVHFMHGVYLLARDPDGALAEFHRELEIAPSNADAATMLAWAKLTLGEPADALPYAEQAAKAAPAASLAQYVFGRALVETGDVKDGLEHLKRAEKMDSSNIDTHVVLAAAYSRLGRPQDARRERRTAIEMTEATGPVAQP